MMTFFWGGGAYIPPSCLGASHVYQGGGQESISLAWPGLASSLAAGRLELDGATPDNHTDKDLYVLLPDLI